LLLREEMKIMQNLTYTAYSRDVIPGIGTEVIKMPLASVFSVAIQLIFHGISDVVKHIQNGLSCFTSNNFVRLYVSKNAALTLFINKHFLVSQ
jgi:hypothetical protein